MVRLVNKDKLIPDIELTEKEHSELCRNTWVENKVNKTKVTGIHFEPGKFNPGLNFPIFLDLSEPYNGIAEKLLLAAGEPKPKPGPGILIADRLEPGQFIQFEIGKPKHVPNPVGRINYKVHNYCARCKIKYPKGVYRCKNCNSKNRTKAWASNYSRKKRNG